MKIIYTILFFSDTVLLICLSWLFLHKLDHGGSKGALALIVGGIALCIFLLIFSLKKYIQQPDWRRRR